jgi:hypothetical protein
MKNKLVFTFGLAIFLLSGYFSLNVVQANQPVQILQPNWRVFAPSGGGFRVLMPGVPTKRDSSAPVMGEIVPEDFYYATLDDAIFQIYYIDFPRTPSNLSEINQLLVTEINRACDRTKPFQVKNIRLGRYPGKEGNCQNPTVNFLKVHFRYYLVGRRFYGLATQMESRQEITLARNIEVFLNSFHLL